MERAQQDEWDIPALYFWQGSHYVSPAAGLPPSRPKPAGIRGFAKLKPGHGQGKAAKSLVQGSGDFVPLLNASMGMTGLNSNQRKTGNFKPRGAMTPFSSLTRDGTPGGTQTDSATISPSRIHIHGRDGTSFPCKAFRRDFIKISASRSISPHPWEGRGSSGTRRRETWYPGSPLHRSVQQVEERLEHYVLHTLAGVVQLGREEGDGGSRRVPHALARKQGQAPTAPEDARAEWSRDEPPRWGNSGATPPPTRMVNLPLSSSERSGSS